MERFGIIQGEGKPDPVDQLWKLGGAVVGITKKSVRFGVIMAAETGNAVMYVSGQRKYAEDLEKREPKDRIEREAKTAKRAFSKKVPDIELGKFAVMYVASGIRTLVNRNIEEAKSSAPVVVEILEALPDTDEGIEIAEDITVQCFEPLVNEFNRPILRFRTDVPHQRPPSE